MFSALYSCIALTKFARKLSKQNFSIITWKVLCQSR